MLKKALSVLLCLLIIASLPDFVRSQTNASKKLRLFAGAGLFSPSFDAWNTGIEDLHNMLTMSAYTGSNANPGIMEGGNYLDFGVEYFFTENISAALSIGHFEIDLSNPYTGEYTQNGTRPLCTIINNEQLEYKHDIRVNPALISLAYTFKPLKNNEMISVFAGGGVGYYFSSIKNELYMDMNDTYLYKEATVDTVISLDMLANLKANVNAPGYHLKSGININYGILNLNLEVGYHFAKADIGEEDWTYFTQKYQYLLDTSVNYKCYETTLYQIREEQFDNLKIDELDLSGLMFKADIGLFF